MSTFVPDPNLVVEALRAFRDADADSGDEMRSWPLLLAALPHAEAIAEMWDWTMPQAAAVQELIAAARPFAFDFNDDTRRLRAALKAVSA